MTDQKMTADESTSTDQPTTTSQATRMEPAAAAGRDAREPGGTRELRDAQRRGTSAGRQRPPIRAEGENAADGADAAAATAGPASQGQRNAPLFDEGAARDLRTRWVNVQTEFVDEPRAAVQKADSLVAEVLQSLTDTFAREREELESGWSKAGDGSDREVSTEDLRQAIQRYRSFFNRLLAL
jgi:hypothetical protein